MDAWESWVEGIKVKTSLEAAGQIRGNSCLGHGSGIGKGKVEFLTYIFKRWINKTYLFIYLF